MYQYPYGDTQQLNLDWLMEQWQETKASIDGSLQGEIDRVEAAITDLLTARDQAVAAKTAAETAATAASGYAGTASGAASTATAQATAAAASAALAGSKASDAQTAETNAALQATAAANSAAAAAVFKTNAGNSETAAAASSSAAAGNALYAEGMAKGTQNGNPVASGSPYYENNAAYWAAKALDYDNDAALAAYYSEAMAKGTMNGTPVTSDQPGYEDNAEYYKDQAAASAASADGTNAQKMIAAPEEASSTASAAHAAGTYFRYNNKLYKATQDIALGGTITPNTNCVEDTVCAELTAQSEQINGATKTFTKTYMSANKYSTNRLYNAEDYNIGKNLSDIYNAQTTNAFAYMLDVTLSKTVSFPVGNSSSTPYGYLAFDKNDICVWVYRNLSGHTAGDVVTVTLPENSVKMLLVFTTSLNNLGTEYTVTLVTKNTLVTLGEATKITDKLDIDSAVTKSFTGDDFVYGSQSNGVFDSNKHAIHTDYIPIDSGEKVVFTNTDTNVARIIAVFDASKTYSKIIGDRNSTATSTWVCDTVGYIRLLLATKDYSTIAESSFDTYAQKIVITSSRANAIYPAFVGLQDVESKVSTIYPKIQTYPETYDYDTKSEAFDALFNGSGASDAFIFFTDPHLLSEGEKSAFYDRFMNYTGVIGGFFKRLATSFAVCAGDWLEWNDTPNLALYKLNLMTGRMRELFGDHYYPVIGNHDTNEQGTEVSGVKTLSDSTLRNVMFPYQSAMYYSFKSENARYYVLNTGTDQNTAMSFGDRWTQIAWLAEQLAENDDAHGGIFMHILWNTVEATGIATFADNVQELIGAYNGHTTITLNSVTYDFTNCTGKIGFILGGHIHKDQSDTTNYSVPVIATINTQNNANYPSFDLVLVDWTANTMNMVRVGSGSNQTFTLA